MRLKADTYLTPAYNVHLTLPWYQYHKVLWWRG